MTFITYTALDEPLAADIFNINLDKLSSAERQKVLRYVRWQDAHASLAGKMLLLEAFKQAGVNEVCLKEMYRDSYDKPYLANAPYFNISHSGKYVVCAVSKTDTPGIDIEEVKPIAFEDFKAHFTMNEWQTINSASNRLEAFYQHWCAKEAFIKRDGKGLSNPLSQIEISGNIIRMGESTSHVQYFDLFQGYKMALATEKEADVLIKGLQLNRVDW